MGERKSNPVETGLTGLGLNTAVKYITKPTTSECREGRKCYVNDVIVLTAMEACGER